MVDQFVDDSEEESEEDDEDMLDLGQSYSVPLTIPINMILVPVD